MKITARVTFTKYANREFLVQAFFDKREFSPKNKIRILDDETAFVQLEFDKQPPMFIIKALSHCKINIMDNMEESSIEELMRNYESNSNHGTLVDLEDESLDDVLTDNPDEYADTSSDTTLDDDVDDTAEETPDTILDDDADDTAEETPDTTLDDDADDTAEETPDTTPDDDADDTSEETPDTTPDDDADDTSEETPDTTPDDDADDTSEETPDTTPDDDADDTAEETPDTVLEEETDDVADAEPDTISDDETHSAYDDEPDDAYEDIPDEVLKDDAGPDENSHNQDEKTDEHKTDTKSAKKSRRGRTAPSEEDYLDIPAFDDLAENSYSFPGFVTSVGKWMNFSEDDASYFFELTMALSKYGQRAYELRLKQIKEANARLGYTDYRRSVFSKKLTKLLEDYHIDSTMIPFLCTVLKYNGNIAEHKEKSVGDSSVEDDSAHDASVTTDVSNEAETSGISDTTELIEAADEVVTTEVPDNGKTADEKNEESHLMNNPNFANIMASVNREATLEEQIKELLSKMGLDKTSKVLYNKACAITIAAFSMETLESIDAVMQKAGMDVSSKDGLRTKINFSEWINRYNKANHIKRMKVIAFLRELKTIFTLE